MTIETVVFNAAPLWLIMISTSFAMDSGDASCLVKEFGPMEISSKGALAEMAIRAFKKSPTHAWMSAGDSLLFRKLKHLLIKF